MTIAMMKEFHRAVEQSIGAKVLLIRAEGKAFCAGADVGEHLGDVVKEMLDTFHGIFGLLERFEGPTIAAVHGAALGGGCELAAFCDVVLASDRAKFGQPESKLGVIPPVAAVLWPRVMGYRKALQLIVSGDTFSAEDAHALGLVNEVYPADTFDTEVARFVEGLSEKSIVMMSHAKRACLAGQQGTFADSLRNVESIYLDSLMKSHDADEGLRAFLEKRQPEWKDR
jgi:cyclohexa-1,5-dienecarbonyl-CoA hydratase